jgi:hypothetical protein
LSTSDTILFVIGCHFQALALLAMRIGRYCLSIDNDAVLVSTMNDVPGYKRVAVHGEVFGLICRARNAFSSIGAGLRTITGS